MKQNLKKEKKINNTKENVKKVNFFHLFTIIAIALLVVAIIVEVIVIVVLNNKIDNTQNQIENLPSESSNYEILPEINELYDLNNISIIDIR